ncbi:glycosyltransferase family 2 protein [Anoxybacillus kestanbolensis]|uniref:glycosyltransferase family 2 protein n=1 Tax=Anoxybacillus kestanbolensis TaxID=227476 RepID=UPI003D1A4AD7
MENNTPKVAIIIVNYNGYEDTIECLNSLSKISYPNFEVIVVDNHSSDKRILEIKNIFPEVHLVSLKENKGFAGANNEGIRYCLANLKNVKYFLLLNNDTEVDKNFLFPLVDNMEKKTEIGACSPLIFYFNSRDSLWFGGGAINWLYGKPYHLTKLQKGFNVDVENEFLTGCALLLSEKVISNVGFMEESYFLYFEDVAYCLDIKAKGFKLAVVEESKIWHKVSSTTGYRSALSNYYGTRNNLFFMKSYTNKTNFLYFFILFTIKNLIKITYYLLKGNGKIPKAILFAYLDFILGNLGKLNRKL